MDDRKNLLASKISGDNVIIANTLIAQQGIHLHARGARILGLQLGRRDMMLLGDGRFLDRRLGDGSAGSAVKADIVDGHVIDRDVFLVKIDDARIADRFVDLCAKQAPYEHVAVKIVAMKDGIVVIDDIRYPRIEQQILNRLGYPRQEILLKPDQIVLCLFQQRGDASNVTIGDSPNASLSQMERFDVAVAEQRSDVKRKSCRVQRWKVLQLAKARAGAQRIVLGEQERAYGSLRHISKPTRTYPRFDELEIACRESTSFSSKSSYIREYAATPFRREK